MIFMLGFESLITWINVVNAARMSAVGLLCCPISFVPRCIVIKSAGFFCNHPTSCLLFAILTAKKPECPSLCMSYVLVGQPAVFWSLFEPTKLTFVYPAVCNCVQRRPLQHTISVIESPNGMYRILGVVTCALDTETRSEIRVRIADSILTREKSKTDRTRKLQLQLELKDSGRGYGLIVLSFHIGI